MHHRLVLPTVPETPVIVEVPHAGLTLDPESLALCTAPARSIGRDADLFVDELFADAPEVGATLLVSELSRYVCDLNRAPDDLDSNTTPGGTSPSAPHGVVWRRTTEGRPALGAPLTRAEIDRRLDLIYRPYHKTLSELVEAKLARFGYVVLLSGHSMPSFGRLGERRADVVPGTRGRSTADEKLIAVVDRVAHDFRYDIAHDTPYRGGYTTGRFGSPERRLHAIQVELARRLYMNETTLERTFGSFSTVRTFCRTLVDALGKVRP